MKLAAIIMMIALLQVSAKSYGQKKINLDETNAPLKLVLQKISKQSGYVFFYDTKEVQNKTVTVKLKDATVVQALDNCLQNQSLVYKIIGKTVILQEQSPPGDDKSQVPVAPIKITDTVLDEKGQPLSGATIKVKGANTATASDTDGSFSIVVPDKNAVLVFSFVGYLTLEVPVGTGQPMTVKMIREISRINELVVVGYGTQRKVDLTGAVSTISGKDVDWKPVGNVSQALQGTMPGVTVTTTSGQPGDDGGTINIRGVGTLNNTSPLILVDGVAQSLDDVDENDIASITVLKDAASASIYGVRAANGVILVTTKRGQAGKTQVSYSDYFGWQSPVRLPQYVGAQEFMKLENQMYENSGSGAIYTQTQINAYNDPNRDVNTYPDNSWIKAILTGNGFQQQHSIAFNGGTEKSTYRFSANYFDQNGLITNQDFDRLTMRLNTDSKLYSWLSFSADVSGRFQTQTEPEGIAGSSWFQFGQAVSSNPLNVIKYTDGTWGLDRGQDNAIRRQTEGGMHQNNDNMFNGDFRADLKPVKGLIISGIASGYYDEDYDSYQTKALTYFTDFPKNTQTYTSGINTIAKTETGHWYQRFAGTAQYEQTVGKHYFKLLVGAENDMDNYTYLYGYRLNPPDNILTEIDAYAADGQKTNGNSSGYSLVSQFGRLNYSFADKYLLEANIRRDGSSRFADGHKWGAFPSVSAGWRISSEDFMKNVSFVQDLKLRASWGELGNDQTIINSQLTYYPYQANYILSDYPFNGTLNTAAAVTAFSNTNLTWETTKMTDIGVDLTVFKKLGVTFDYFDKVTSNILMQLPIPETVGLQPSVQNAGKVGNKGWELALNYRDAIGKDFKFSVGASLADVRNKILDIKGTDAIYSTNDGEISTAYKVGEPIGAYYGYIVDGIFQTQAQVAAHATQPGAVGPGDFIYRDVNGDGKIDDKDKVYLGSGIPRYTYGVNLSASYKGFDLSVILQGVGKVSMQTVNIESAPTSQNGNFRAEWANSWTPTNTGATLPRLVTGTQNYQASSYWVQSSAYMRLKSTQLGYTFPANWIRTGVITKVRFYVSGQNLLTFSKLPADIDPEAPNDSRYYPQVKIFTFGLNANF